MITQAGYRALALSLPEARESSHFANADFRVHGKIFATLRESGERAVIKLTPEQQRLLAETMPAAIFAVPGGWGLKGWTQIDLAKVDEACLQHVLDLAWRNTAPKTLLKAKSKPCPAPGGDPRSDPPHPPTRPKA